MRDKIADALEWLSCRLECLAHDVRYGRPKDQPNSMFPLLEHYADTLTFGDPPVLDRLPKPHIPVGFDNDNDEDVA